MSYFNDFLQEELDLVLSIPVRVGFWISHSEDVEGTSRDDEKERLALEKVLSVIQDKTARDSFTHEIVSAALDHKELWQAWEKSAFNVLQDIPKAIGLVRDRLPEDALRGYQKAVYYIANIVAQAACEQGGEDDLSKEMMGGGLFSKILDRLSVKTDMSTPDNVSAAEKAALQKLQQSLKG